MNKSSNKGVFLSFSLNNTTCGISPRLYILTLKAYKDCLDLIAFKIEIVFAHASFFQ